MHTCVSRLHRSGDHSSRAVAITEAVQKRLVLRGGQALEIRAGGVLPRYVLLGQGTQLLLGDAQRQRWRILRGDSGPAQRPEKGDVGVSVDRVDDKVGPALFDPLD